MSYCTRQRRQKLGMSRMSTSVTSHKRCLRKRRTSLHYNEEDSQSDSAELSPLPQCKASSNGDNEVSFSFERLPGSKAMDLSRKVSNKSSPALISSLPTSGRSSVISCDSDDSGVSSKSGSETVCLPETPDKSTRQTMTIEVVSPASRGIIELREDGDQGFIAYYKPDSSNAAATPLLTPVNSAFKRPRVTRSISSNSCDSAFLSSASRQSSIESTHTIVESSHGDSDKISCFKLVSKDSLNEANQAKDDKVVRVASLGSTSSRKEVVVRSRSGSPNKRTGRNLLKSSEKRCTKRHRTRSQSESTRPKRVKMSKQTKNIVGKSPLRRIQHHNRSPERSLDTLPAVAGRHCRTRSHAKAIMKDVLCTPVTDRANVARPKRSPGSTFRRCSGDTSFDSPSKLATTESISKRIPTRNLKTSEHWSKACVEQSEDSGVGSDDQGSVSSSACNWRFCKTEVSCSELVDHIERLHVASQRRNSKVYRCYWEGCKVYGKVAKSIVWLEGHVKKHLGPKPHHCIFPECNARFSSQELLEKHVDTHITDCEPQQKVTKSKIDPCTAKKSDKKSMKRMRGTEKCIPKRTDFFTSNLVEATHWEHKMLQERWSHLLTEDQHSLHLHGQIVALSSTDDKETVQIHWYPEEFGIPDSWHGRNDEVAVNRTKTVKLSLLPRHLLLDQ